MLYDELIMVGSKAPYVLDPEMCLEGLCELVCIMVRHPRSW